MHQTDWTNSLRTALSTCAAAAGAPPEVAALSRWMTEAGDAPLGTLSEAAGAPSGARYQDLGLVARGGMGEVRRVMDARLGRVLIQKILRVDRPAAAAMFYAEACVTAQLAHPCVVPVHDFGTLDDGRPFYTMKLVEGRTFQSVVQAVSAAAARGQQRTADGWGRRRLLSALVRVCEALALAHARGIIHRDLKPDNLMIGAFGEVLVLDWGLALPLAHLSRPPMAAGTPGYMAPEQARGEPLTAATDVFALGSILCAILTGRPAIRAGSLAQRIADTRAGTVRLPSEPGIPAPLRALAAKALSADPAERPAEAGAFGTALRQWLDDDAREAEGLALVSQADALLPEMIRLAAAADRLRAETRAQLKAIPTSAPPERRHALWAQEDAAATQRREADVLAARYVHTLQAALSRQPSLEAAHQRLADQYHRRAEAAAPGSREAAEAEAWVRRHDRGRHAAWLSGRGEVAFFTDPPGAAVRVYRFGLQRRRLVPTQTAHTVSTPCARLVLEHGSYLARITHPGCDPIQVPFVVPRGAAWDNTRPGASAPHTFRLPLRGTLRPGDRLVPAGWAELGDETARYGQPRRRVWIDAFVMRRHPVTNAEFLAFLNDLLDQGDEEAALRWQPREQSAAGAEAPVYGRGASGRFVLVEDSSGDRWHPDWPVLQVSWPAARAWCRWYRQRTGRGWRLPWELEREKAASGADGRPFPWGKQGQATWCRCRPGQSGRPLPATVGAHPEDESVYGIQDLAGNCRDWCADLNKPGPTVSADGLWQRPLAPPPGDGWRSTRGGAWSVGLAHCRAGVRIGLPPAYRISVQGFRAAADW